MNKIALITSAMPRQTPIIAPSFTHGETCQAGNKYESN
jgi:hypothetical protein